MTAMGNHFLHQPVFVIQKFLFGFAFQLSIFFEGIRLIGQSHLHLHSRTAGLGRMSLIHANGEPLSSCVLDSLIYHWELLQRGDDNPLPGIDGFFEVLGGFLLPNGFHAADGMVKAHNGFL